MDKSGPHETSNDADGDRLCGAKWHNDHLADLPHRCVIRLGWHVNHACHCGAMQRVSDDEHVHIARRAPHANG